MPHNMNPNKPGVMIYFKIRRLIKHLTYEQKGRLLDAILDYGEFGAKAEFLSDTLLDSLFDGSICPDVEQDDERFTEKSLKRKYANYCKWSQKQNTYYVEREEWEKLGCPTFLEIKKKLLQVDSSGGTWNRMDVFYSIWNTIPIPITNTHSFPNTIADTSAETTTPTGSAAPEASTAFRSLSPALCDTLTQWVMHWEEVSRKTFGNSSRNALTDEFRDYAEEYGAEAVVNLVREAISSGYKSIPWDRLERRREQAANGNAAQNPEDELRSAMDKFREETRT